MPSSHWMYIHLTRELVLLLTAMNIHMTEHRQSVTYIYIYILQTLHFEFPDLKLHVTKEKEEGMRKQQKPKNKKNKKINGKRMKVFLIR